MASKTVFTGNPKSEPTTEKIFTVVREQTPQRPGKVLTREAQNPKQTPRKVGKPTEQLTEQGQALDTIRDLEPDKTARTHKNMLYQAMGEKFVKEYKYCYLSWKYFTNAKGCMEQLGRMIKDGMEADAIAEQAKIAAAAINEGRTVKQVEAYLRHGRITGEWNESLLTATREAASNTAKPVEGLTPADLIAIKCMLEAFANDNDTMAKVLEDEGRIKPGEWYDPYYAMKRSADTARMYADKVKAAFEVTTGEKYPKSKFNPRWDEEPAQ